MLFKSSLVATTLTTIENPHVRIFFKFMRNKYVERVITLLLPTLSAGYNL